MVGCLRLPKDWRDRVYHRRRTCHSCQAHFRRVYFWASLPEISRGLARDGISSATGKSWSPTVLAKILRNEKYCGDVLIQKTYTVDHITQKRVVNDQAVVPSYYVRDHHKAIIDRKTFETAQVILSLKNRHKGATRYPYYGRLPCPVCGGQMVRSCIGEHGHPPVWRCSGEKCGAILLKKNILTVPSAQHMQNLIQKHLRNRHGGETRKYQGRHGWQLDSKKSCHRLTGLSIICLTQLVDRIVFPKWDTMVVEWTFGLKSRVKIEYLEEEYSEPQGAAEVCRKQKLISD